MPDVNPGNRPLSPHITIYRPQITSISSILTRITGNALLISALLVVWWFLAAATSPDYFDFANAVLTSLFGKLVMVLSLWGLCYHLLAGLRHLYWDNGGSMEIEWAEKLGWACVIGSVVLTVVCLLIIGGLS